MATMITSDDFFNCREIFHTDRLRKNLSEMETAEKVPIFWKELVEFLTVIGDECVFAGFIDHTEMKIIFPGILAEGSKNVTIKLEVDAGPYWSVDTQRFFFGNLCHFDHATLITGLETCALSDCSQGVFGEITGRIGLKKDFTVEKLNDFWSQSFMQQMINQRNAIKSMVSIILQDSDRSDQLIENSIPIIELERVFGIWSHALKSSNDKFSMMCYKRLISAVEIVCADAKLSSLLTLDMLKFSFSVRCDDHTDALLKLLVKATINDDEKHSIIETFTNWLV